MDGYKTYSIAILMVVGTFVLILKGTEPPDSWWQVCAAAAAMVGVREAGDKNLLGLRKGPSTLTDVKPGS